jgi:hypothetical protein
LANHHCIDAAHTLAVDDASSLLLIAPAEVNGMSLGRSKISGPFLSVLLCGLTHGRLIENSATMWAGVGMLRSSVLGSNEHHNLRAESLLRHAERAGDLGDSEVSGHCNGRRWHRGADIPGDPVPAPDALQELPNAESEGEPGHQTNQTPKRNR